MNRFLDTMALFIVIGAILGSFVVCLVAIGIVAHQQGQLVHYILSLLLIASFMWAANRVVSGGEK
jgi:hypothetical protein